jgi:hypothetical protein
MSYDYDLEQPAEVHWIPVDLMPPQEIGGGNELTLRHCAKPYGLSWKTCRSATA